MNDMTSERKEHLKLIAKTVMRAWNGGNGFNDNYFESPFGSYILRELEKVVYPDQAVASDDATDVEN